MYGTKTNAKTQPSVQTGQCEEMRKLKTKRGIYLPELENLVTDLVPSEMACLDNSPGRMRRTEVWISRDEIVDFLEYDASSECEY